MNRSCARPGCDSVATCTLSYAYAERIAWLDDLHPVDSPANHDLCRTHGDRTRPPKGWEIRDRRSVSDIVGLRYAG